MRSSVSMTVRQGKAYLPTLYRSEKYHLYARREPVLVADLTLEGLLAAIEHMKVRGNPSIELPEDPEEWRRWVREAKRRGPELKAAGVKSWKEFGQKARAYEIDWTDEKVIVQMSKPFAKGGFTFDRRGTLEFPPDTPLRTIVKVILADIQSNPELLTS